MHVADIPCGAGRHSIELARRGIETVGVDLMPESIGVATERARWQGMAGLTRFEVGDMRRLKPDPRSDAVIVMRTSFWYAAERSLDEQILANLRGRLKPGGRILLDLVNPFRLAKTTTEPRRWRRHDNGTVQLESRNFDLRTARREVHVELLTPEGEHLSPHQSMRIYFLHELEEMLRASAFASVTAYRGYDGGHYGLETKRLIVVAVAEP
ncbi:SAM-dependent methyltransferase [Allorhizocola rhizosphaerae]|uniref:SAM-dependent methyltransferase n=1 Tax=Allorhizocola rhizosphaerae TaxID=1872709 RepID=UPI001FE849BF